MIPLTLLSRYAIPLIVAAIYLGDVDIPQQFETFEKTQRLSDQVLSQAKGEGQDENGNQETFDYIIVGGGSAGAVLANRLTQSGSNRVLLLEAGGDPNPIMDVPYAQRYYFVQPNNTMDWGYSTVKQNRSCGVRGGYCYWPRGKALGGSSSVNGLVYNRCKPQDYNRWAEFTGDSSWSWDNVKDTFNRLEDYHGSYEATAGDEHGRGGEMYVGTQDYNPGMEVVEEALKEKGFPMGDLNGGIHTYGFGRSDYNIKNGLRWGTYQAFLEPILNRSNLVIYRYAYVQRVDMDPTNTRAIGVTYKRHGIVYSVKAEKEVILSGGTVESAKVLLLSGIGPKDHLEEIGIPTLIDLPVGKYLQDHMGVEIVGENGGFRVNTTFGERWNTTEKVLQFIQNGTGPLNGFSREFGYASESIAGYLSSKQNPDRSKPDVHLYLLSMFVPDDEQAGGKDSQQFYFSMELNNVTSVGTIKLATQDPEDKPVIDPNFFEHPEEVEILIDVLEIMLDIYLNSTTFRRLNIQPFEPFDDHCKEQYSFPSRNYWRCYIQYRSQPYSHPTSTCRMGPNATVAVVDSKLKVFGTENLRVVDASVIPFVPRGNINLPVMLVGARGAEIILSGQ